MNLMIMKTFKLITLIFLIGFISFSAYSQKPNKDELKAIEAFEFGEFAKAIELYRVAYAKTPDSRKPLIVFNTAICYKYLHNSKSAELWFRKAEKVKYSDPIAVLYYADAKKMNGKFEEAIIEYKKYKKLVPDDPRADIGIKSCKMSAEWISNPTRYEVENMALFNSKYSDFSPVYAKKDYKVIYFSSNREGSVGSGTHSVTGAGFYDLWMTNKDRKGKYSIPTPVPGETVNTSNDEGASSLNPKGNTLYFTRCKVVKKRMMGCQIFWATKKGVGWGEPQMLQIPGASDSSDFRYPAISFDDLTLYFSAKLSGGKGGTDIWKLTRPSRTKPWSEPINMGNEINTRGNEVFPYEKEDKIFYFSSDYHAGMGGLDIFKAVDDESGKYAVENMKYPVNSAADDFGVIFEGNLERGYFSSNRKGGKGYDDIYEFVLPLLEYFVAGKIIDKKTNRVIVGAKVILKGSEAETKEITTEEMLSEADGSYRFKLNPNTDYQIQAEAEKYLNGFGAVSTVGIEENKEFKEDIYLDPIWQPIKLDNIFYDLGKAELRPESMVELDRLIKILNDNPTITIELGSHTDFRSPDAFNLDLSQRRAQSVIDYLIEKNIPSDRLVAKGYGEGTPATVDSVINSRYFFLPEGQVLTEPFIKSLATVEEQEVAHELNRRSEFKVLKTDYVPESSAINKEEDEEEDEGSE